MFGCGNFDASETAHQVWNDRYCTTPYNLQGEYPAASAGWTINQGLREEDF